MGTGTVLHAVKVSDLEEVSDQDTDNNVIDCKESICVLHFKNIYSFKYLVIYLLVMGNNDKIIHIKRIQLSIMKRF